MADFYDGLWRDLGDFARYNPGARHRRRHVARFIRDLDFTTVLDLGCGAGEMLTLLREKSPRALSLCGADVAAELLERNRSALPWARFVRLDIERGHLAEEFDLVLCCEVLEHLHDQAGVLQNLGAMVAPGGHLLITCPTGPVFETETRFGHVRHPTADRVREIAVAAGLEPVHLERWGFPAYAATKWLVNLQPDWAMAHFARGRYSAAHRLVSNVLYWMNFANLRDTVRGCQLFCLFRKPHEGGVRA